MIYVINIKACHWPVAYGAAIKIGDNQKVKGINVTAIRIWVHLHVSKGSSMKEGGGRKIMYSVKTKKIVKDVRDTCNVTFGSSEFSEEILFRFIHSEKYNVSSKSLTVN